LPPLRNSERELLHILIDARHTAPAHQPAHLARGSRQPCIYSKAPAAPACTAAVPACATVVTAAQVLPAHQVVTAAQACLLRCTAAQPRPCLSAAKHTVLLHRSISLHTLAAHMQSGHGVAHACGAHTWQPQHGGPHWPTCNRCAHSLHHAWTPEKVQAAAEHLLSRFPSPTCPEIPCHDWTYA
jgi:hypothetical protein